MIVCKISRKFIALLLLISMLLMSSCYNYPLYIDDPALYSQTISNNNFYKGDLPESAEIVRFSHYNNWNEDFDTYLELSFRSEEDLIECLKILAPSKFDPNGEAIYQQSELFLETPNPYNSSYTDLVNLFYVSSNAYTTYTGYSVRISKIMFLKCNFGVISYSLEDLKIVQASMQGSFSFGDTFDSENYTPKYFEYFNIAINENTERIYEVIRPSQN